MKIKPKNLLDAYNLKVEGTQYTKSIKIPESLYNILVDVKEHNSDVKTISDVIMRFILIAAVANEEEI